MPTVVDPHAWVLEAVDLYELPLARYARRLLGDFDLAADAVQHAFVKLCEESEDRLAGRVAPWLFRVCRNRALDHLRRSGRERSLDDGEDRGGPPTPSPAADPADLAERSDLAARLKELLRDLPPAQREAIDLWCEGFTYREISEITGRLEGSVRVLAHRGLAKLRDHPLIRDLLAPAPAADTPPPHHPHQSPRKARHER